MTQERLKRWNGSAWVELGYQHASEKDAADGYAGLDSSAELPVTTLKDSGVSASSYGSATQVPVITVDAKGRVTAVTATTITGTAPGGSAGGQLAGTYPNPTLANVGVANQVLISGGSGTLTSSADLTFNDSTNTLTVNGASFSFTDAGSLLVGVGTGANALILEATGGGTNYAAYYLICRGPAGEPYCYITGAGSPRSPYTSTRFNWYEGFNYHRLNFQTAGQVMVEIGSVGSTTARFGYIDADSAFVVYDPTVAGSLKAIVNSSGRARLVASGGAVGIGGWGAATPANIFRPNLSITSRAASIDGTAYFVYLGFVTEPVTLNYIRMVLGAAGSGSVNFNEVGLFSTPLAPNAAGQTLTKIVATGTLDASLVSGTGVRRNNSAFAQAIPAGTHLWAGYLCSTTANEPQFIGCGQDAGAGQVLTTASATQFTSGSTWSGSTVADAGTWLAPHMQATVS